LPQLNPKPVGLGGGIFKKSNRQDATNAKKTNSVQETEALKIFNAIPALPFFNSWRTCRLGG
jgi:hypothetical protein